mgnify:CR=1 FL=1
MRRLRRHRSAEGGASAACAGVELILEAIVGAGVKMAAAAGLAVAADLHVPEQCFAEQDRLLVGRVTRNSETSYRPPTPRSTESFVTIEPSGEAFGDVCEVGEQKP